MGARWPGWTRSVLAPTLALSLAASLAGCASLAPDPIVTTPSELAVDAGYAAPLPNGIEGGAPADLTDWWTRFDDPVLTQLVEQSVAGNLDLAVAASRLVQAREALVQARTGRLPAVRGSVGLGRSGFLTGAPSANVPVIIPGGGVGTQTVTAGDQTNIQLGADASYTIDLFGAVRNSIDAASAEFGASALDAEAVRVSVVSEVARNYIGGRVAQERLAIARDSLAIARDNEEIAGFRVLAGLVSAVDEEQARAQRAQRLATIPPLQQQIAQAANRLGVLTGQAPAATDGVFTPDAPIPRPPETVAIGLPADLLRQRPDVAAAERRLAAAGARVGVARAQLYPAFTLSGQLNNQATGLSGVLNQITYGLFGGLTQTLFDGGRLRSQVRQQEAAVDGAFADYRRTILGSLEDVENALRALRSAEERVAAQREALDAAQATAIYARSNYRAGLSDFTTLLTVENQLLTARDGLALARGDQALASVQLFNALGGGSGAGALTAGFGSGASGGVPSAGTTPQGAASPRTGSVPSTPPPTVPARPTGSTPQEGTPR